MVETTTSVSSDRLVAPDELALVERDQILREIDAQISGRVPSLNVCVSIEGAWGMGRSALVEAACQVAERSGYAVVRARASPSDRVESLVSSVASSRMCDRGTVTTTRSMNRSRQCCV